jgi:hypothetical protein
MSDICPNAHKRTIKDAGKIIRTEYKCNSSCTICKGEAHIAPCPGCDGWGLRVGGIKCMNCDTTGKVPLSRAAQGALT